MEKILRDGKSMNCPACRHEILFTWFSHLNRENQYIYSKDGNELFVRNNLFNKYLDNNSNKDDLDKKINAEFSNFNIYSISSNVKCHMCGFVFPEIYPNNLSARINDDRPVVIDGMQLRTERGLFIVAVQKPTS